MVISTSQLELLLGCDYLHHAQMRTVGGRINTLAALTQTVDNESYEATGSKLFVISIIILIFKKTSMSIQLRIESYMLTAIEKILKMNVASRPLVGRQKRVFIAFFIYEFVCETTSP